MVRRSMWVSSWIAGWLVVGVVRAQPNAAGEPALTPLELKAAATITCASVEWDVRGDANANATGTLEYREAGAADWLPAFPLHRSPERLNPTVEFLGGLDRWNEGMRQYAITHFKMNYLAGSVIGLKPATKYELRVTLSDPDGGATTRTITVTTRLVPAIPKGGRMVEVRGGGAALKNAAQAARPGDVLVVHAGKYDGGVVVSAQGSADKPVCITAAGDGEVLLDGGDAPKGQLVGIRVTGPYVRIQGLSFRNFSSCVLGERQATNLAVMRCTMNHFFTAVHSQADDGYFADNTIRSSYNALDPAVPPGERNEGTGIHLATETSGNVVCHNSISLVADGIRFYSRDSDCYGNDVIFNVDDAIELDDGGPNLRVTDNRFSFTGENGISFQPYIGGPAYIVRNLVIGAKENTVKNRYASESAVFINNTMVSYDGNANALPFGSYTRNNLFLTNPGQGQRTLSVDVREPYLRRLDMDYDGFGPKGPNGLTLQAFAAQTRLEKHGVQFSSNAEILAHPPGTFAEYQSKQWTVPEAFLTEKGRPHPDLSLKPGSPAIGAGITVPNLMQRPDGKAPDLGALQFGQPAPHYGPRP